MARTRTRELERRNLIHPVEFRAAKAGQSGPGTLVGYALKYNMLSQNLGGFVERVAPGAVDKSLADSVRVLCRYNHDDACLLGTTEAGTLTLNGDDVGLLYEDDLPDTTTGRDCAELAKRGDLRYSSFAFYCIEDEWDVTDQGFPVRTLLQIQLVDVAPVNSPAYMDSTVAVRSLSERINIPVAELKNKPLEEVRALIAAPPSERAHDPEDTNVMTQTLGWLTAIDSIVDEAQEALASYLSVPNPDPAEKNALKDKAERRDKDNTEAEQGETHSVPVSVQRALLDLNELK